MPSPINRATQTGELGVLGLTSQFPHPRRPHLAAFNRQQFGELARLCRLSLVAPVPFTQAFGPPAEGNHPAPAFPVSHPAYWYVPRLRRDWHGRAFLLSVWPALRRAAASGRFDVLLATWLFPDGWAAASMAQRLGLPLVIKLHGSDVNVFGRDPRRRPLLSRALQAASRVVAVSRALCEAAVELGADRARVRVVPNGIDRELFTPRDQAQARRELGLPSDRPLALFVGRLEPVKGPDLAIQALARLEACDLVMVGAGSLEAELKQSAAALGVAERVHWAGQQSHGEIPRYVAAADMLILPSRAEGQPNAVLEAVSAGRPVAAASVGGVPEIVKPGEQGFLCPSEDPAGLAEAMGRVLARSWDPAALSASMADRSWHASAEALCAVLAEAASEGVRP